MTYDEIRSHLARSERDAGLLDDLIAHEREEAVAAEREAYAKVATKTKSMSGGGSAWHDVMCNNHGKAIAAAIRARTS